MKTDERFEKIDYCLKKLDISRIFGRTGKKNLIMVDGFSKNREKVQIIGRHDKEHGIIFIEFIDTPLVVFYSTLTLRKNKIEI